MRPVAGGRSAASVDRAAFALGVASVAGAGVGLLHGTFEFVHFGTAGFVVALVVGAVAAAGGWFGLRALVLAAGATFLLAALVQVALLGRHGNVLGGNGSTVSLWLGLGAGLLVLAATPDTRED